MGQIKSKTTSYVLVLSIIINLGLIGYLNKMCFNTNNAKIENQVKVNKESETIVYFLARDEVFTQLPSDSNEVIMLGNSLTQNFEWHEIFPDVNIKNRGINGDITLGLLQRLPEVLESKPLKIFIEIGINDIQQGIPIDQIYQNYTAVIQKIKKYSPTTKIYVQNLLPAHVHLYNNKNKLIVLITDLNTKLEEYCLANSITYIDLFSTFKDGDKLNSNYDSGDHLHLNGTGYLKWCELIEKYIYE